MIEIDYSSKLLPSRGVATIDTLVINSDDLIPASGESIFQGFLRKLLVYVIDTARNSQPQSVRSSITSSDSDSGEFRSGRSSASSTYASGNATYTGATVCHFWQQRGYINVAALDYLGWKILDRDKEYHEAARLPALEVTA